MTAGVVGAGGAGAGDVGERNAKYQLVISRQENAAIKGALIEACTELELVRRSTPSIIRLKFMLHALCLQHAL